MLILVKPGMVFSFADENFAGAGVQQEIDAGHAGAVDGAVGLDGQARGSLGERLGQGRRDDQLGVLHDVFGVVAVEIIAGADFAGNGGDGLLVAEDTDTSISRAFGTPCSTSTRRSKRAASSRPSCRSERPRQLVMPTEEPRLAGLVKMG